jgi:type IV secretion system protein VirB10
MATRPSGDDPRLLARLEESAGVKPVVAVPRGGLPTWALIAGMVIAAVLLFIVLDSRRRAFNAPAVVPRRADAVAVSAAPPPLFVPPALARVIAEPVVVADPVQPLPAPTPPPAPVPPPPPPQIVYVPQPTPMPMPVEAPMPPPRTTTDPALVVDTGTVLAAVANAAEAQAQAASAAPAAGQGGGRARAGMLANRSTTVPQGTLIPAVLETALDSNRPGFARAIVSRNVRGFDGSRVLIPRGSRLIGEYRSEASPGQRRALISWTRLIRPDGVTIAIDSPAGDPLGRGGIRARVNTHFWSRFAGAILQSVLDIGVNLAGRASSGTVVVLPSGAQAATQVIQPAQITPTLTVRQGTSISIFVARDLDFTGAESRQ